MNADRVVVLSGPFVDQEVAFLVECVRLVEQRRPTETFRVTLDEHEQEAIAGEVLETLDRLAGPVPPGYERTHQTIPTGDVVALLAAADPVYDTINCFFCNALAPVPPVNRGPAWREEYEDHEDDCPWWMARQLLGLPSWPTDAEEAAR